MRSHLFVLSGLCSVMAFALVTPACKVTSSNSLDSTDTGPEKEAGSVKGDAEGGSSGDPVEAGNVEAGSVEAGSPEAGSGEAGVSPEGALIRVTTTSRVGVLLDEIPMSQRDRVAAALLAKPDAFFIERAKRQLVLATYRLNFRASFYPSEDGGAQLKQQLPLPPDSVFDIELLAPGGDAGGVARRAEVEGHDYVLVDYKLTALLVTDKDSPGTSEPMLGYIGGTWDEPFIFPVDPELLIQRTGYACMDEAEFPPNSVDSEDPEFFYDQECEVEPELTKDGCHYTEQPESSCVGALTAHVGSVALDLHYERIAWDEGLAAAARVGEVESPGVADLDVVGEELSVNRLTYRYIGEGSCALAEACVGGTGWRRLLQFNASEKNVGTEPINVGNVDYFVDDPENPTPNANHHVYQFSACHGHYHFNYFATFTYGGDSGLGSKRAFCLESVARYSNHEYSPTWSPYSDCSFQGISPGWGDQYNAGIECQWVDVTTIDTSEGAVTQPLGLRSNPEGFLCEGAPVLDDEGQVTWEETDLTTETGDPVDRPVCDEKPDWDGNNYDEIDVTLPTPGKGMITEPCTRGQIGPLRNCGYAYDETVYSCTPGETVTLSCSGADAFEPHAVRVCEASHVLGAGVACVERDALGKTVVESDVVSSVTFTCPEARDATETGGKYSLYTGPVFPEDEATPITCAAD
jgi:Lysyl oxidase